MVNCQSDGSLLFRSRGSLHGTVFRLQRLDIRRSVGHLQALAGHAAQFATPATFSQLPWLGVYTKVDPPHVVARHLSGVKCFVERPLGVCVFKLSPPNQCDAARRSRSANRANGLLHEPNHPWVRRGRACCLSRKPESGSARHKNTGRPLPFVFVIGPLRPGCSFVAGIGTRASPMSCTGCWRPCTRRGGQDRRLFRGSAQPPPCWRRTRRPCREGVLSTRFSRLVMPFFKVKRTVSGQSNQQSPVRPIDRPSRRGVNGRSPQAAYPTAWRSASPRQRRPAFSASAALPVSWPNQRPPQSLRARTHAADFFDRPASGTRPPR